MDTLIYPNAQRINLEKAGPAVVQDEPVTGTVTKVGPLADGLYTFVATCTGYFLQMNKAAFDAFDAGDYDEDAVIALGTPFDADTEFPIQVDTDADRNSDGYCAWVKTATAETDGTIRGNRRDRVATLTDLEAL